MLMPHSYAELVLPSLSSLASVALEIRRCIIVATGVSRAIGNGVI